MIDHWGPGQYHESMVYRKCLGAAEAGLSATECRVTGPGTVMPFVTPGGQADCWDPFFLSGHSAGPPEAGGRLPGDRSASQVEKAPR